MASRTPLSLAQHFDAPENHQGVFGWMCGYSADVAFLNDAIERFTRETQGQRAARGSVTLAMMLDPGQPAIMPVDVPGLIHLPIQSAVRKPFRLLHAKVALLGFRHVSGNGSWILRLIVSTGNWTRQTLEESLDLAWCIEVNSEEDTLSDNGDDDLEIRCADIRAAWSLFKFLHRLFDLRILNAGENLTGGGPRTTAGELAGWIKHCIRLAADESRFFDNRHSSLLAQLPAAIRTHASSGKRNYLAMGSGFFEGSSVTGQPEIPSVLNSIVKSLVQDELLVRKPEVDVFVNPSACQAVALALPAFANQGWQVRRASPMEHLFGQANRSLHAKFLFGSQYRENNNSCLKPWVYLGSGNLTAPGFTSAISPKGGNLETGVVFAPENLNWLPGYGIDPDTLITHHLPLQWDKAITAGDDLRVGGEMPPPSPPFTAPPVAWLSWETSESGNWLMSPDSPSSGWDVLDTAGIPCPKNGICFDWKGPQPRQVEIRWKDEDDTYCGVVPVLDAFGRLAAVPLGALDFEEAWSTLVGFPMATGEDDGAGDDQTSHPTGLSTNRSGFGTAGTYPIRQMMELIERVAERQTGVVKADWRAWCVRLEQTLLRVAESPVIDYFRLLELNPLSPLRRAPFRPSYAEDSTNPEGRLYEMVLDRIEFKWQTSSLGEIGGKK